MIAFASAVCEFLGGDIFIEIKINKEVRDYQESIFFGLSLRQFICSAMALAVAVICYFILYRTIGTEGTSWICILSALPFALCGFFKYNGMYFEQFARAVIRSELLSPKHLAFRTENLYVEAMKNSSIKEVLRID